MVRAGAVAIAVSLAALGVSAVAMVSFAGGFGFAVAAMQGRKEAAIDIAEEEQGGDAE